MHVHVKQECQEPCFPTPRCNRRRACFLGLLISFVIWIVTTAGVGILPGSPSENSLRVVTRTSRTQLENRNATVTKHADALRTLALTILSSKNRAVVQVDGVTLLDDQEPSMGRGMHVVVLDGATGHCTGYRVFDTYSPTEDLRMIEYLNVVPIGRIIVIVVKDEASYNLGQPARNYFSSWGSLKVDSFSWRDMWIMVANKNASTGKLIQEKLSRSVGFSSWGAPVTVEVSLAFQAAAIKSTCGWLHDDLSTFSRRREFCANTDGYPEICRCSSPESIWFKPSALQIGPFVINGKLTVPVAVIAGNRATYLKRMLRALMNTTGINPGLVTVFVDGMFDEPVRVANLYGVSAVQQIPGGHSNARIAQHYKSSISAVFELHPTAEYAIVLEEDLDMSQDFLNFIAQTLPVLRQDPTLYCISAWNDLGYENTVGDPAVLYRVESMPGLGWVIGRKLFKEELEPNWPSQYEKWDWDMWMRTPQMRKGRECIIPDVSRTHHFGSRGLNMNPVFQDRYFDKHVMYTGPAVRFHRVSRLTKDAYELLLEDLLQAAIAVDHNVSPCRSHFFPDVSGRIHSVFLKMAHGEDFASWLRLCRCLKIWDLDQRGSHRGLWRFHARENQPVVVIGVPASPYSSFMPNNIVPIDLLPATAETVALTSTAPL